MLRPLLDPPSLKRVGWKPLGVRFSRRSCSAIPVPLATVTPTGFVR